MIDLAVEYKTFNYLYWCLPVILLWAMDFWSLLTKTQLIYPQKIMNQAKLSIFRSIIFLIALCGLALIAYAATQPRQAQKFEQGSIEVNDIFFVFDVSRSMLADDLRPNRLEVAKDKLREFVSLRPRDRIGVILFSEKVFTLLPLTSDLKLIDQVLADIRIGYLGSGTNIGDGLALAVARGAQSEAKNKVIILLTDGVSNVGNMTPLEAAEIAKNYKMKVYVICIGTDDDAKIPLGAGPMGQRYQNIPGGSVDMDTSQKIADMTGGRAYYANTAGSLKNVLSEIDKLERTEIKGEGRIVYDELYWNYLALGALLFVLAELLRRFIMKEYL
jgi:Ca-activated chloride channel family protein